MSRGTRWPPAKRVNACLAQLAVMESAILAPLGPGTDGTSFPTTRTTSLSARRGCTNIGEKLADFGLALHWRPHQAEGKEARGASSGLSDG